MKYVIAEVEIKGEIQEVPFLFPNIFMHKAMPEAIRGLCWDEMGQYHKIVSAGFMGEDGVPFGRSESLNIKSREIDNAIIKKWNKKTY